MKKKKKAGKSEKKKRSRKKFKNSYLLLTLNNIARETDLTERIEDLLISPKKPRIF